VVRHLQVSQSITAAVDLDCIEAMAVQWAGVVGKCPFFNAGYAESVVTSLRDSYQLEA
jgi:hypothetical protein